MQTQAANHFRFRIRPPKLSIPIDVYAERRFPASARGGAEVPPPPRVRPTAGPGRAARPSSRGASEAATRASAPARAGGEPPPRRVAGGPGAAARRRPWRATRCRARPRGRAGRRRRAWRRRGGRTPASLPSVSAVMNAALSERSMKVAASASATVDAAARPQPRRRARGRARSAPTGPGPRRRAWTSASFSRSRARPRSTPVPLYSGMRAAAIMAPASRSTGSVRSPMAPADHLRVGAHRLLEHREEEVVLALEVLVERAEGLAGLVGDLLDGDVLAVRAVEDGDRRPDQVHAPVDRPLHGRAQRPTDDPAVPVGRASLSRSSGVARAMACLLGAPASTLPPRRATPGTAQRVARSGRGGR